MDTIAVWLFPAATRRTGKPTKKQTMAAADVTCGLAEVLVFIGALVAGTACSLCSKVLLSMRSVGASGEEQSFQNPLFQTWGMFLGMVFALPVHFAVSYTHLTLPTICSV